MRSKQPRVRDGYHGGFGGVGTRPADRAWTPPVHRPSDEANRAPRAWPGLRLRRKSARDRNEIAPTGSPAGDIALGLFFILCAFGGLLGATAWTQSWGFAPLLFIGLCATGAIFLGRGISKRQVRRRARDPAAERRHLAAPGPVARFVGRAQGWLVLAAGCVAWGLVALPALGAFHPFKLAIALALYVGLGVSLDVNQMGLRRRHRRKGYTPGRHTARATRWSPLRRGVATVTGVAVVALGLTLITGAGPDGGRYVLRIGLGLLVACAFGLSLIFVAATSGPQPRRRA